MSVLCAHTHVFIPVARPGQATKLHNSVQHLIHSSVDAPLLRAQVSTPMQWERKSEGEVSGETVSTSLACSLCSPLPTVALVPPCEGMKQVYFRSSLQPVTVSTLSLDNVQKALSSHTFFFLFFFQRPLPTAQLSARRERKRERGGSESVTALRR